MRKTVFLLASLFVMVLATQRVNAQNSASAEANATATIVKAISIEKKADLQFGKIFASSTAGKVAIGTDGSRNASGGVSLFTGETSHQAASFKTMGSQDYNLTLPADGIVKLTGPSGSTQMTIEGFGHSATKKFSTDGTEGEETFFVGGTLNVGANQTPGQYTGTFTVTAAYY